MTILVGLSLILRKLLLEHVLDERLQQILREQFVQLRLEALENPLNHFINVRLRRRSFWGIYMFKSRSRRYQKWNAGKGFTVWRRHGRDTLAKIGMGGRGFISGRVFMGGGENGRVIV